MTKRARQREKAGRVTDSDGYKGKRVPESHRSTTADFEEMPDERDYGMLRRATKERWPIRPEARGPLADMMTNIGLTAEKVNDRIQATKTVVTMDTLNQKDEHQEKEQETEREAPKTNKDYELSTLEELQALGLLVPDRQGAVIKGMNGNGKG